MARHSGWHAARRRAWPAAFAPRLFWACCILALTLAAGVPCALGGMLFDAQCPCGYETKRFPLFGGRASFKNVCLFPALCEDTGELIPVNLLDPAHRPEGCPTGRCIPYTDPLLGPTQARVLTTWRLPGGEMLRLFDGGYLCPRCRNKTLRFRLSGFWD